jgi:3-oxoacyl-[acyl-carrier-protein] synthase II
MELGSLGAFLVLEEKSHAIRRSANPLARLARVVSDHVKRAPGAITQSLERMWSSLAPAIDMQHAAVISGASGVAPVTAEERDFLGAQHGLAVRATGTHLGQGVEPQFFANIALAAAAVQRGLLFPPTDSSGVEQDMEAPLRQAVVTGVGHWRGEGLALVAAVA